VKETWRWFGPQDPIPLEHVKQTGATEVVSALHHRYRGEAWPLDEVLQRKAEIESAGLPWSVVESIPVHNSIKLRSAACRQFIARWKSSLAAVAKAGIKIVCYNFMLVADWTRTDSMWLLPSGGYTLRFDEIDLAVYDLFILERHGAEDDYPNLTFRLALDRFQGMSEARREDLEQTIIAGLPAAEAAYDREMFRHALADYEGVSAADGGAKLIAFLAEVAPVAEEIGVRLAIHPDDPRWPLFGLPRVVSTAGDLRAILAGCNVAANGLTFCVGSFGARADNDLLAMAAEFAPRIHFAHLRQVKREQDHSFYEAEHLAGSSDMVGVVHALLTEERRRHREDGLAEEMPMRPDHGHLLATDWGRQANPGYTMIGRLNGLAELRGVVHGPEFAMRRSQLPAQATSLYGKDRGTGI
jgi:mannonate dehydratase